MATYDAPLDVPDVTLAVARGASSNPAPTGAPSISSVTDNGDGTLTIIGSNFGSKAQAAPITFERFDGGTDGQLVADYNPDWMAYQGPGSTLGSKLSADRSHSGTVSASNRKPEGGSFDTNWYRYPQTDVVRVSYWYYVDAVIGDDYKIVVGTTTTGTQIKALRVTSTEQAGGGGNYNGAGSMNLGGVSFYNYTDPAGDYAMGPLEVNNGVTWGNLSPYQGVRKNTWQRIDMMIKLSDPGVANGERRFQRVEPFNPSADVWKDQITVGAGQNFKQDSALLGNMIVNYHSDNVNPLRVYTDDVYIDTTWAAVEIGDNPDYYLCGRRDFCVPSAWSATSATVSVNSVIPTGINYLFLVNELGEPSPGYEVTL